MRTALPAADWLTRAAWSLSAAVHVGAAAAFIGWSPPTKTEPQAIAVTLVAMAPATDLEAGSTEVGVAPAEPAAAPSAEAAEVETPVREPIAPEPAAPEPIAPEPELAAPEPPAPEPASDNPPAAESVAALPALPLPAAKPPAPKPVPAPELAGEPRAAEAPAEIRTQSAMTAPPAPAPGSAEPSGAPEMTPARLDVAGLANPDPAYPMTSRMRREEGTVLLEVTVSPAGTVSAIRVVESSGHSRLDKAALDAVRSWRFVPARLGDQPIEAVIRHRVVFRLDS